MKAWIYTGGELFPESITEHPKGDDLVIAADAGLTNALALGVTPQLALGDFDSYDPSEIPDTVRTLRVPAEKDFTDTQLAVEQALRLGADEIVIVGGLGGRTDHALSNLSILEELYELSVPAVMLNGRDRVRFLKSGSTLVPRSHYRYLSLVAVDERLRGVSIEGCRYPLKNETLTRKNQYAVSNEITENCALVSIRKGGAFLIESTDR